MPPIPEPVQSPNAPSDQPWGYPSTAGVAAGSVLLFNGTTVAWGSGTSSVGTAPFTITGAAGAATRFVVNATGTGNIASFQDGGGNDLVYITPGGSIVRSGVWRLDGANAQFVGNGSAYIDSGAGTPTRLQLGQATNTGAEIKTFDFSQPALPITANFAQQRFTVFEQPTISGAFTITNAATVAIAGAPIAAGGATITNPYALWVQGAPAGKAGAAQLIASDTAATTAFTGSASGTFIAANAATGFAGNLIDLQVNGGSVAYFNNYGGLTLRPSTGNALTVNGQPVVFDAPGKSAAFNWSNGLLLITAKDAATTPFAIDTPAGFAGTLQSWRSNGVQVVSVDNTGKGTFNGGVVLPIGTDASPLAYFSGDATTGFTSPAAGYVNISSGGTSFFTFNSTSFGMGRDIQIGWAGAGVSVRSGGPDTGIKRASAGVVQITNGTTGTGSLIAGQATFTAAAPTVGAGQIGYGATTATTATAGTNGAPPALVAGYIIANVAGTNVKIPYYAY